MIRNGKQVIEDAISPEEEEFVVMGDHIRHLRMQRKALIEALKASRDVILDYLTHAEQVNVREQMTQIASALTIAGVKS